MEDLVSVNDDHIQRAWIKTLQGLAQGIQCFGGEIPFFFLVRLDNQKYGSHQVHDFGTGSYGHQDVSLHSHLESSMDHCNRTVERRVASIGFGG